ncbi:MAG: hypothetical protein ACR2FY_09725 [Pirellulaceae bacterium]
MAVFLFAYHGYGTWISLGDHYPAPAGIRESWVIAGVSGLL